MHRNCIAGIVSARFTDDVTMADEMITRSEFVEYMAAFEERINARFDNRVDGLDSRVSGLDKRLIGLDNRVSGLDNRLIGLDNRMNGLEQSMKVQFEATHSLIRLSLEGLQALRETTDAGFTEMRQQHDQQTTLLHTAVKHIRQRVERVERH